MNRRVAVTGLGPLLLWEWASSPQIAASKGVSGISKITQMDTEGFAVHIGSEVKDFDPTTLIPKELNKLDRFSQFAIIASDEAVIDAGLKVEDYGADRIGVVIGSGVGGLATIEENLSNYFNKGPRRISPFVVPKMMCNTASGQVSIYNGFKGPNFSVVTACASANHSIDEAYRLIKQGFADAMVTGGSEAAITILSLGGFCSAKALSNFEETQLKLPVPSIKLVMGLSWLKVQAC